MADTINLPTTISASRVGAMLGVDPRMSPLALYHSLRGEIPQQDDAEVLYEGRYFEDAIAKIAAKKYSLQVDTDAPQQMVHGVLSGHADRFWNDGKKCGVLEIKNTLMGGSEGEWGDPGTDKVPMHYWFQSIVYGHLYQKTHGGDFPGMEVADFVNLAARLFAGTTLYKIRVDVTVIAKVEEEAKRFLDRIHEGNPPDPRDEADMRMRWLAQEEAVAVGGQEQLAWVQELKRLSESRKSIEKSESELKTMLLGFAKEASKIVVPHPTTGQQIVIATLGADRQFDADRFMLEQPDTAARYLKIDATKLGKEQRKLYEQYMRKPENALEQKRTIRLKEVTL